jgi:hypothetical protein
MMSLTDLSIWMTVETSQIEILKPLKLLFTILTPRFNRTRILTQPQYIPQTFFAVEKQPLRYAAFISR